MDHFLGSISYGPSEILISISTVNILNVDFSPLLAWGVLGMCCSLHLGKAKVVMKISVWMFCNSCQPSLIPVGCIVALPLISFVKICRWLCYDM